MMHPRYFEWHDEIHRQYDTLPQWWWDPAAKQDNFENWLRADIASEDFAFNIFCWNCGESHFVGHQFWSAITCTECEVIIPNPFEENKLGEKI